MKGASQIAPMGVRIPEELKEKLQARAKANGRSNNAEIVQILEDALGEVKSDVPQRVDELISHFNELISLKDQIIGHQSESIKHLSEHVKVLEQHISLLNKTSPN